MPLQSTAGEEGDSGLPPKRPPEPVSAMVNTVLLDGVREHSGYWEGEAGGF